MNTRLASVAAVLLTLGPLLLSLQAANVPAIARQVTAAKPAAPTSAHSGPRKSAANKNAPGGLPDALAAMPEAERLAIQGDLAWLGYFSGLSAEEFGARTLDAIKAFQKRHNGKETGTLIPQERAMLADAAKTPQAAVGWRLIDDSATGALVGVPEKFAPRSGAGRTGSRWTSALGQIQIETFRLHEASLPVLFEQEKKTSQRQVGYGTLNPDSFVIVGEQRQRKFVMRAQSNGSEVRGVTVLYDQATEGTMAPIAVAIADTFVGFPDPNVGLAAGHKRGVEYGSAIAVSDRGDLLTVSDITDACQFMTVPGYGHAERVAEDKTNGLALLRLYGANRLVPAAIAGDDATNTNLTLFGIADPLAQSGDGTVSSSNAVATPQGITPAPKSGFSGALALDGQGHFAGIVALKSSVAAGIGPVSPQATLVPAAVVRAFLAAQSISPAPGNSAVDQSVVRLICVRK